MFIREITSSSSLGILNPAAPVKIDKHRLMRMYKSLNKSISLKGVDDPRLMIIAKALARKGKYL